MFRDELGDMDSWIAPSEDAGGAEKYAGARAVRSSGAVGWSGFGPAVSLPDGRTDMDGLWTRNDIRFC